jgi:opacity protein-like surface antigen
VWSQFDAFIPAAALGIGVGQDAPLVGGQIGLQHQFGQLVVGVEGSLSTAFRDGYAGTNCVAFTCAERLENVFTIGPRLGWAIGKWMPYISGGYASGAFEERVVRLVDGAVNLDQARHGGWYLGGGVDMALSAGWTVGLDYRHYEFNDATYFPNPLAGGLPNPALLNFADATADSVTIRVSWKLGRPEPVVPLK